MWNNTAYRKQAQIFQALSHPVRLHILDIVARQEACVCHLTTILGKPQPYVSQQLAALREAGLVIDRREANLIYYRLADAQLAGLLDSTKGLVQSLDGQCPAFPPIPEGAVEDCPCPRCQAELCCLDVQIVKVRA